MGLALLLTPAELRVAATTRKLREHEYLSVITAEELVDKARSLAERLARQAEAGYEARMRAAAEQGLAEGREQARHEALHQQAQAAGQLAALSAGAGAMLLRLEESLVDTVLAAMKGILQEMPAAQVHEAALRKVSRLLRDERFLSLHVAPQDEAHAKAALDALRAENVLGTFVDLKIDASLPPLSSILESEAGVVNASLDIQLDAIREALRAELGKLLRSGE